MKKRVLSNVWWPLTLTKGVNKPSQQKTLTIWMNSTIGLTILFLLREETEGAWVDFKKPTLSAMPVIDLKALSKKQLELMSTTYDRFRIETLKPFPEMADDEVRAEIDKAVSAAFNLPDLSPIRNLLAREPIVCLRQL